MPQRSACTNIGTELFVLLQAQPTSFIFERSTLLRVTVGTVPKCRCPGQRARCALHGARAERESVKENHSATAEKQARAPVKETHTITSKQQNLKSNALQSVPSQGMVLAASTGEGDACQVEPVTPPEAAKPKRLVVACKPDQIGKHIGQEQSIL